MPETLTLTISSANGDASRDRSIPRRLGPVTLEHEIGRGAAGVVFRGRHEILGRDVAVKVLLYAAGAEGSSHFDRFRAEARAAAAVRHPHLTMIHHADVADGIPYLVMDYVDGPSLGAVIKRSGALSVCAGLVASMAMADAVAALHSAGIVHRDIKSKNTLLDRDGTVLVTDFGLALARTTLGATAAPLGVAGTPAYMAPEMFDGLISERSDVYALGVTAYELLVGSIPFSGTLEELRIRHLETPIPTASMEGACVPPGIIEIVERATHKQAAYRYKTAKHLLQALERVCTARQQEDGQSELKKLALRSCGAEEWSATDLVTPNTPTSTYFGLLGQIADQHRTARQLENHSSSEKPVESVIQSSDEAFDAHDQVGITEMSIPCVKCNYSLRGLGAASNCPECGEPVATSTGLPRLMFADPKWLRRVQVGFTIIGIAPFLFALSGLVFLSASNSVQGLWACSIAYDLFLLAALFLVTSPDKAFACPKPVNRWRWGARVAGCIAVAGSLWKFAQALTAEGGATFSMFSAEPVEFMGRSVAGVGFFLWLSSLAERNHDATRRKHAQLVALLIPVFGVPAGLLEIFQPDTRAPRAIGLALSGAYLAVWIVAWVLAGSFRKLIKSERLASAFRGPSHDRAAPVILFGPTPGTTGFPRWVRTAAWMIYGVLVAALLAVSMFKLLFPTEGAQISWELLTPSYVMAGVLTVVLVFFRQIRGFLFRHLWTHHNTCHFPELSLFETEEERLQVLEELHWSRVIWTLPKFWVITLTGGVLGFCVSMRGSTFLSQYLAPRTAALLMCIPMFLIFIPALGLVTSYFLRKGTALAIRRRLNEKGMSLCLECGYDLRGQVEPRCPECGTKANLLAKVQSREPDPNGILRLQKCPKCGYDLKTLPARHRCPECGFAYDEQMFSLHGWSFKDRFSAGGRLLKGRGYERTIAIAFIALFGVLFAFWIFDSWSKGVWSFPIMIYLILWGAIRHLRSLRAQSSDQASKGQTQMLFTPEGVSIRSGPGEASIVPWQKIRDVRIRRLRLHDNLWLVRLRFPFWRTFRQEPLELLIECTKREAALVRNRIRRRLLHAASETNLTSPEANNPIHA